MSGLVGYVGVSSNAGRARYFIELLMDKGSS